MPEFVLHHGTPAASEWLASLDSFTLGYVTALFFTDTGTSDDEGLEDATVADLSEDAKAKIIADCAAFISANAAVLDTAATTNDDCDHEAAGRDFLYTRQGHGLGYWSREGSDAFLAAMRSLDTAAKSAGAVWLYRGDDGRLYLA